MRFFFVCFDATIDEFERLSGREFRTLVIDRKIMAVLVLEIWLEHIVNPHAFCLQMYALTDHKRA